MLRKLFLMLSGRWEAVEYIDAIAVARAEREERIAEAQKLGIADPGPPQYLVDGLAKAKLALGPRHVLHKGYKAQAETWEDFLRQPPRVLETWRSTHIDPKQRQTPEQVAAAQAEWKTKTATRTRRVP